jgi:hypothetical protein
MRRGSIPIYSTTNHDDEEKKKEQSFHKRRGYATRVIFYG